MGKYHKRKSAAGKGDAPKNCFSPQFRSNYDSIDWSVKPKKVVAGKKP